MAPFLVYSSEQAFASDTDNPQWHKYYQLGKFLYSKPPKPDQIFIYQYRVTNGTVIEFKGELGAFTAQIQGNSNATFEIKIPRNFPYTDQLENGPRYGDTSPLFLMDVPPFGSPQKDFANTKTLKPANKTSDCFFTYSIPFSGNHKIQFAWTYMLSSSFQYHGDIIPQYCNDQTIANNIPPLQQIKAGVDPKDVKCIQDFRLVIKSELGSPACVKSDTAKKLVERGWMTLEKFKDIYPNLLQDQGRALTNSKAVMIVNKEPVIHWQSYYPPTPYASGYDASHIRSYEEFSIVIYSTNETDLGLYALNAPTGAWIKFVPQHIMASPHGSHAKMIMSGYIASLTHNPISDKIVTIQARLHSENIVAANLSVTSYHTLTVLHNASSISFGDSELFNSQMAGNHIVGAVYDPVDNSGSLPVKLSVLGLENGSKITPVPPWLKVDIPIADFTLNSTEPYYFTVVLTTSNAPQGTFDVVIGENIGNQHFVGKIRLNIFNMRNS